MTLDKQIKIVWVILLALIVAAILAGCTTAEKLLDKAERKDAAIVAKYARDKYPCTLLKNDTAIIWKDSVIYIDCPDNTNPFEVVIVRKDTVQNTVIKTIRVPVKVQLPSKVVTRWYEDSAKLKINDDHIRSLTKKVSEQTDKIVSLNKKVSNKSKENWIWRAIALCLMAWQGWKIYRKIMIKI